MIMITLVHHFYLCCLLFQETAAITRTIQECSLILKGAFDYVQAHVCMCVCACVCVIHHGCLLITQPAFPYRESSELIDQSSVCVCVCLCVCE